LPITRLDKISTGALVSIVLSPCPITANEVLWPTKIA